MCLPTTPSIHSSVRPARSSTIDDVHKTAASRGVTFGAGSTVMGTVLSLDEYTLDELERCWWSTEDRQIAHFDSKRCLFVARTDKRQLVEMNDAGLAQSQALAKQLTASEVELLLQQSSWNGSTIKEWSRLKSQCRGLEKHLSPFQRRERVVANRKLRALIVDLVQLGTSHKEIASIYSEKCAPARIHARFMGQVDFCTAYRRTNKACAA